MSQKWLQRLHSLFNKGDITQRNSVVAFCLAILCDMYRVALWRWISSPNILFATSHWMVISRCSLVSSHIAVLYLSHGIVDGVAMCNTTLWMCMVSSPDYRLPQTIYLLSNIHNRLPMAESKLFSPLSS